MDSLTYVIPPDIPEGMTLAEYRCESERTRRAQPAADAAPTAPGEDDCAEGS